jgi:hypothetical protein
MYLCMYVYAYACMQMPPNTGTLEKLPRGEYCTDLNTWNYLDAKSLSSF